ILSTVHVSQETDQRLFDSDGVLEPNPDGEYQDMLASVYELGEYGYLLHVPEQCSTETLIENELADLASVVVLARSLNCDWIRLDRNGPRYEGDGGLTVYL